MNQSLCKNGLQKEIYSKDETGELSSVVTALILVFVYEFYTSALNTCTRTVFDQHFLLTRLSLRTIVSGLHNKQRRTQKAQVTNMERSRGRVHQTPLSSIILRKRSSYYTTSWIDLSLGYSSPSFRGPFQCSLVLSNQIEISQVNFVLGLA